METQIPTYPNTASWEEKTCESQKSTPANKTKNKRLEAENTPKREKEKHRHKPPIFGFHPLVFGGVMGIPCNFNNLM